MNVVNKIRLTVLHQEKRDSLPKSFQRIPVIKKGLSSTIGFSGSTRSKESEKAIKMWAQRADLGQGTTTRGKWTIPALLLCLHMGCIGFFVCVAYTSAKIKSYARLVKDELESAKLAEDTVHAHLLRLTSHQELSFRRQSALIENLMSQAGVMIHDLEIIAQDRERRRASQSKVKTEITFSAENARRRTENTVRELWNFVHAQLAVLEEMLTLNHQTSTNGLNREETDSQDVTTTPVLNEENTFTVSDEERSTPSIAFNLSQITEGKSEVEVNYTRRNTDQDMPSTAISISVLQQKFNLFKQELGGYRRAILDSFDVLRKADNAERLRLHMSKELGNLVQKRLKFLQNPTVCDSSRMLGCQLKMCGFGCNFHHFVYCLITAYATNRPLILYPTEAWRSLFKPESESCIRSGQFSNVRYTTFEHDTDSENNSVNDVEDNGLGGVQMLSHIEQQAITKHKYLPLNVPQDLAPKLAIFHGNPAAWWIGQIAAYLFRPTAVFLEHLASIQRKLGFKKPIVGVHVRRTDKIASEAEWHSLKEYMVHVEDYFDQLQRSMPHVSRRVFLATDDASLLDEAIITYPDYTFVSDNNSSKIDINSRELPESVKAIATDIYLLSRTDFLVCTFSSQVCRLAYELMQTLHGDASQNFRSLDDIYYFGGQLSHDMIVLEPHKADSNWKDTIDLKKGDTISVAGNHWNGFSKGRNKRTGITGLYPSYKVDDPVSSFPMPIYPNVHWPNVGIEEVTETTAEKEDSNEATAESSISDF